MEGILIRYEFDGDEAAWRSERGLGRHAARGQPRDVISVVAILRTDFSRARGRRVLG